MQAAEVCVRPRKDVSTFHACATRRRLTDSVAQDRRDGARLMLPMRRAHRCEDRHLVDGGIVFNEAAVAMFSIDAQAAQLGAVALQGAIALVLLKRRGVVNRGMGVDELRRACVVSMVSMAIASA